MHSGCGGTALGKLAGGVGTQLIWIEGEQHIFFAILCLQVYQLDSFGLGSSADALSFSIGLVGAHLCTSWDHVKQLLTLQQYS